MANFFTKLLFGESEQTEEQKNEHNFDVFKYDGIKAAKIGKNKYAIRCFQEALDIREDVEVLEHLTQVYTKENRLEDAIETAGRLIHIEPENVPVLLLHANLNYMAGNYDQVIADCNKSMELDPAEVKAHYMAGRAKKMKGDPIGAIVNLSQAITLKDDYAEAWLLRAEIMLETGDYADGLQDAAKALELVPEEENAYPVRGKLQEASGKPDLAEQDHRNIIEPNPFNAQSYLQLRNLPLAREPPAEPINLRKEGIELKPVFARAYHERGRERLMKGDKAGSLEDMKKAMELGEDTAHINGNYSNFEDMYKNRPL